MRTANVEGAAVPRERILVVDDDDDVRASLTRQLQGEYEVDAATCGQEAIARLQAGTYDAVIADLRMPDIDGIEVLEHARAADPETVRILLTGHVDEHARHATRQRGAPFKVGKPWHDDLEVTLRRALEYRDIKRQLASSVADALAVAGIDDDFSGADGLSEIAQVLTRRALDLQGVATCGVTLDLCGRRRVLAGSVEPDPGDPAGDEPWALDEALSEDGTARFCARGAGASTRDILLFMVERARRWSGEDPTTRLARKAAADPSARDRLSAISRRAALGSMTSALVHELASLVQSMQGSVYELDFLARERLADDPEAIECLDNANETARRMLSLFRAMRSFVRSDERTHRPCSVESLVSRAVALCGSYVNAHTNLRVSQIPDATIHVNEPLFLQVLVSLLRNAADVSPKEGHLDLEIQLAADRVRFSVTDDGAGVPADRVGALFEPFSTTKADDAGAGLGLAIAAEIVREHGGTIDYEAAAERGARFIVTMPLAKAAEADELSARGQAIQR
jgi:signal transduction histidine kinase